MAGASRKGAGKKSFRDYGIGIGRYNAGNHPAWRQDPGNWSNRPAAICRLGGGVPAGRAGGLPGRLDHSVSGPC